MVASIPADKNRTLKIAAGIAISFTMLVSVVIFLLFKHLITFEMSMLMLVTLVGMYIGFGILIAVYRLVNKLEQM